MGSHFAKHSATAALRSVHTPVTRSLASATVLAALLLAGCASTSENASNANKVWMRAGSTAHSEFAENTCQATATTEADFKLCMMSAGWKLETPPSP